MRRPLALVLLSLLAALVVLPTGSHSARAQGAGFRASHTRIAIADWKVRIKGKLHWFIAMAGTETAPADGVIDETFMGVGRGTCHTTRTKNSVTTSCTASGPGGVPESFEFDYPGMQSAHAELHTRKHRHVADWIADEDPRSNPTRESRERPPERATAAGRSRRPRHDCSA